MLYAIDLPDRCKGCPLISLETVCAYADGRRGVIGHKCEHEKLCAVLFKHFKEFLEEEQRELGYKKVKHGHWKDDNTCSQCGEEPLTEFDVRMNCPKT